MRTDFHPLTVAGVTRLCDDAVAITLDVPPGLSETFAFRAGQSLTVRRMVDGRDERRSYSICAPEGAAPRIGVREVPDGLFSTWLVQDVRAGDRLEVAAPSGTFTPDLSQPGHHVLVAAGSGITPVLSVASTVLADPRNTVTVLYGNRRTSTVMFADELADLKDRYPARFELVHVLSREPREVELFTGRLDAEKLTTLLAARPDIAAADHWWLCGPFDMVTGAQRVLAAAGVAPGRVHRELFYVGDLPPDPVQHKEVPPDGTACAVTVVLDGKSTTVPVPRGTAVLDGAQRVRPDLPFACKGGVCGTCRARVTAGSVQMRRNFALEDYEVDDGFVLTCQSVPETDRITVDYDA